MAKSCFSISLIFVTTFALKAKVWCNFSNAVVLYVPTKVSDSSSALVLVLQNMSKVNIDVKMSEYFWRHLRTTGILKFLLFIYVCSNFSLWNTNFFEQLPWLVTVLRQFSQLTYFGHLLTWKRRNFGIGLQGNWNVCQSIIFLDRTHGNFKKLAG